MLSYSFHFFVLLAISATLAILKDEKSQKKYTPTWYQYEDEDYMDLLKKDIKFNPMPGMTVSGPCTWETKVTRMENRIPRRISEVFCRESGAPCGDSPTFKVNFKHSSKNSRQILSLNPNINKNSSADWSVWNLRGKKIKNEVY